jgi:hypothetical protein
MSNRRDDFGSQASPDGPTVFLHIGAPKSGTTYLQSRIADNAALARDQGVLWPGPKWRVHVAAAKELRRMDKRDRLDPDGPWMTLAREARGWGGRAVLISMEWLVSCPPAQVSAAVESLRPSRVDVVLTVRDLLRSFVAQWQQMTQQQRPWSWEQFVEEMTRDTGGPAADRFWDQHDVPAILRRWAKEVPSRQIHVVTVPPSGADPELLWTRFCSVLELDGSRFTSPRRVNESLGVVSAELMHRANVAAIAAGMPANDYQVLMRRQLALGVLAPRKNAEGQLGVSAEVDAWIRRRAEQLVTGIRGVNVDVIGDLTDLVPGPSLEGREPSDVTDTELLDLCVDALVELAVEQQETMRELRADNDALRRRINRLRAGEADRGQA